jgi:hypothetical protein
LFIYPRGVLSVARIFYAYYLSSSLVYLTGVGLVLAFANYKNSAEDIIVYPRYVKKLKQY